MDDEPSQPVFYNGHKFLPDVKTSRIIKRPVLSCVYCQTRSDGDMKERRCLGAFALLLPYPRLLRIPVEVEPRGRRKPFSLEVDLSLAALAELGAFLVGVPETDLGHAFWHWQNPQSPHPCSSCESPEGQRLREFEAAKADAIDAVFESEGSPAALEDPSPSPTGDPDSDQSPVAEHRETLAELMQLCREMGYTIRRMDPGGEHVEQWTNDGTQDPADPGKGAYVPDPRYFTAEDLLAQGAAATARGNGNTAT